MKMSTSGFPAAATILLVLLSQSTAYAFSGAGAMSLTFNTSSRAEGMGGAGVGLANILYYRLGYKKAEGFHVDGATEGYWVNLQAGRMGGVRYDWASTPRVEGVPDLTSRTWSFWVDPVAVLEDW